MRQASRLVGRGAAAEDVRIARYAAALARERQRRYAAAVPFRVTAAMLTVLTLVSATLAIFDPELPNNQVVGLVVFAVLCAYTLWRYWRDRRSVHEAERVNRDYLRRAGKPYELDGGMSHPAYVPLPAKVSVFALQMALFTPFAGLLAVLMREGSLTPGKALSEGIPIAAGAAFGTIVSSQRRDGEIATTPTDQ